MAESIYKKIGNIVGKDMRLTRTAAHHPFEFFTKVMEDPHDHRPVRFRYLGAFSVKSYWRKGLQKTAKVGLPEDGSCIYARVPEHKYNKTYLNLKEGKVYGDRFKSDDGNVDCSIKEIQFWVKLSNFDELSHNYN